MPRGTPLHYAPKLQRAMALMGWSVEYVAQEAGLAPATVRRALSGRDCVVADVSRRLLDFLSSHIEEIEGRARVLERIA